MALSQTNINKLNSAARTSVNAEYERLSKNWGRKRWLALGNRYAGIDCIDLLKDDIQPGNSVNHQHLSEYIAASSISHCVDGWSYLGRAIDAFLKGDTDSSRHLGYYAELRAAMSILASEGIGVFKNAHFVINTNRECELIKGSGTHEFTWDALECWADSNSARDLIFSIIKPGTVPLSDWLNNFAVRASVQSLLTKEWLLLWGLDLRRLIEDREARNIASYRPTTLTTPRPINPKAAIRFIYKLWEVLEPKETLRFPLLDRYLLRLSVKQTFENAYGKTVSEEKVLFDRLIESMLQSTSPRELTIEGWKKFLNSKQVNNLPLVISEASEKADITDAKHSQQVLARATLLLRLSTGACRLMLDTLPMTSKSKLKFWWEKFGEDRCLWHSGEEPDDLTDLWVDIRESIDSAGQWLNNIKARDMSYKLLWERQAAATDILGSSERIALWGLGL